MFFEAIRQNPLQTRRDVQQAVIALARPLERHFSAGRARVRLGVSGALCDQGAAELEGFSRPLWGLSPLAAGGGEYDRWDLYRQGLIDGTNPDHAEFWGIPRDYDQRLVEMAAIGAALCVAPQAIWDPLSATDRRRVADWLRYINHRKLNQNNWLFFRVLVNLGLRNVGEAFDSAAIVSDMNQLETFYRGDGWYADGNQPQLDYYVPFAMHYYGLIFSMFARDIEPARCERIRERAARFALQFAHWFAADGAALPFGRSLSYRFAMGAFWGALACADLEALPWGVIKGLWLRHLRWWFARPIFTETGILTIGYGYPQAQMAEFYNSPGSPYWAFKAFAPLALPESHPFWRAEESPLPKLPETTLQLQPGMILCGDLGRDHVFALVAGQWAPWDPRHGAEKYAKFCYSTHFAFSVPAAAAGLMQGAHDSTLALSEDGIYFRVRGENECLAGQADVITSRWRPWPDVEVTTWLVPALPWHVRVHRIRSARRVLSAEGGFALDRTGDPEIPVEEPRCTQPGLASATYPGGVSAIRDLLGMRIGEVIEAAPNTNLLHPRTVIPTLRGDHAAGDTWLACAVLGLPGNTSENATMQSPNCAIKDGGFEIVDASDVLIYSFSS